MIRQSAVNWFRIRYGTTIEPLRCSKYYYPNESWTRASSWAFELPVYLLREGGPEHVHLLCQRDQGSDDFYHLRVPTVYLRDNKNHLFMRNNERLSIFLSAEKNNFFQDQRGYGKVDFAQFLVS